MTIIYISVIGLMLLIIGPVYYSRMTHGYTDMIRRIQLENERLDTVIDEVQSEADDLALQEDELADQRTGLVEVDMGMPSLGGAGGSHNSVVDYLMGAGKITQAELAKAEAFKKDSDSPYDLEEVLVMLDMVSNSDVELARRSVK